jgi:MoaA/NifB/PqqE/SkfB family radical SAM enzyme
MTPASAALAKDGAKTIDLQLALDLAATPNRPPRQPRRQTTRRSPSRRGVIWLGQTCNLHCDFCYFITRVHTKDHPEHAFMPIEKAKKICRTLVEFYGNTSIDIEGGEPTLYPAIFELVRYCAGIGLHPTLITNAVVLDDLERCRRFQTAGIRDFKVSIHGLGLVHDRLVGRKGAHQRQMRALRNLQECGIPFRFNVVLTPPAAPQLPDIARLAIATGALCVNWLGFNPHEDQETRPERFALIPSFTTLRGPLTKALDLLEGAGIETNVRYVPHCMVEERHRKSVYHFQQLFYDHREWDWSSWSWTTLPPQRAAVGEMSEPVTLSSLWWWLKLNGAMVWIARGRRAAGALSIKRLVNSASIRPVLYAIQRMLPRAPVSTGPDARGRLYGQIARLHARVDCATVHTRSCGRCAANRICSGLYRDYIERFGADEVRPIPGASPITDPLYYIGRQSKLVEREDESWALDGRRP